MSQSIELHSGVITATGNGDVRPLLSLPAVVNAQLEVTAAGAVGGDTIDVYVQTRIGAGWLDVVHFSQVIGTTSTPARYWNKLVGDLEQAEVSTADALAAKGKRHIIGDEWRARWVVAGTGSFTLSVKLQTESR